MDVRAATLSAIAVTTWRGAIPIVVSRAGRPRRSFRGARRDETRRDAARNRRRTALVRVGRLGYWTDDSLARSSIVPRPRYGEKLRKRKVTRERAVLSFGKGGGGIAFSARRVVVRFALATCTLEDRASADNLLEVFEKKFLEVDFEKIPLISRVCTQVYIRMYKRAQSVLAHHRILVAINSEFYRLRIYISPSRRSAVDIWTVTLVAAYSTRICGILCISHRKFRILLRV